MHYTATESLDLKNIVVYSLILQLRNLLWFHYINETSSCFGKTQVLRSSQAKTDLALCGLATWGVKAIHYYQRKNVVNSFGIYQ